MNHPNKSFTKGCSALALLGIILALTPCSRAQEATSTLYFEENVKIPMRDGVQLTANIYRPHVEGTFPVILMRTPYGKPNRDYGQAREFAKAGFAMVVQDCRGRGSSEGLWDPFRYDTKDGYDTQQWVEQQPWCNGTIGTAGGSYVGWTQWASAAEQSPFLKTMVPVVPFADAFHEIVYPGGAFQLSLSMGWGAAVGGIQAKPAQFNDAFKYLPLNRWDEQFNHEVFFLRDWVQHSTYDDYWKLRGVKDRLNKVTIPTLNIGGWYDIFAKETLDLTTRVRKESDNRLARRNQFVIMGPWGHGPDTTKLGELSFGAQARLDIGKRQLQWFQYWLLDKEIGVQDWPAYYLFVMGENQWRGEQEWPLARTEFTHYYFHSEGKANTRSGNGTLITAKPTEQPPDHFTYDANEPVPTRGGNNLMGPPTGPFDQSTLEDREDVLVYTTPILDHAVEVTGPVKVILHAASSARDTDFTAKLVDVHPNGKAYNICDGIVRARHRNSRVQAELLEPGTIYRYEEIDLWVTSNLFKKGHRIRVEISSSNFPRFDRNPNSGLAFGSDTELLKAKQTIYHDANHPSHLLLPVIPR